MRRGKFSELILKILSRGQNRSERVQDWPDDEHGEHERLQAEEDQVASYDGRTPLQQRALELPEPHLVCARCVHVHGACAVRARCVRGACMLGISHGGVAATTFTLALAPTLA